MREFDEILSMRRREVEKHLGYITHMEGAALNRTGVHPVEAEHINILKSAFLVHLYNVVESVMTKTVEEIASTARVHSPSQWSDGLFNSWLVHRAAIVVDLALKERVDKLSSVIAEAAGRQALGSVQVMKREPGNWSHTEIEAIASRLICSLVIRTDVKYRACVRFFLDDMPPMKYVRHMRNQLAHGNLSFIEAGSFLSMEQIYFLRSAVFDYMDDVTASFRIYLEKREFLRIHA